MYHISHLKCTNANVFAQTSALPSAKSQHYFSVYKFTNRGPNYPTHQTANVKSDVSNHVLSSNCAHNLIGFIKAFLFPPSVLCTPHKQNWSIAWSVCFPPTVTKAIHCHLVREQNAPLSSNQQAERPGTPHDLQQSEGLSGAGQCAARLDVRHLTLTIYTHYTFSWFLSLLLQKKWIW